jgi:shikimate 5-dehydrogenase
VNLVFSDWCACLGIQAELVGIDVPIGAANEVYRAIVQSIRRDSLIRGALVTTHKSRIFESALDLFDDVRPSALDLHEVGAIFRDDGRLVCEATDPPAVRIAFERLLRTTQQNGWDNIVILGGGGAGLALAYVLVTEPCLKAKQVLIVEASQSRTTKIREAMDRIECHCRFEVQNNQSTFADEFIQHLTSPTLIVNATGMGKDAVGSPLSKTSMYPIGSTLWDFNYRGDLQFLENARAFSEQFKLSFSTGWYYFICGWYQVMTRVFNVKRNADLLAAFERIAESHRKF